MTLARPDLAEQALEGVLRARAYRPVAPRQCAAPAAAVLGGPDGEGGLADQIVFGEVFDVLEVSGGLAWGRARRDGVVGHVALDALSDFVLEPTHRVASLAAPVSAEPGGVPVMELGLNALVTVEAVRDGFARAARAGWLRLDDLAPVEAFDDEPAAVAERFLGAPFRAGGRLAAGLDAPGLVQQALYACGLGCPRAADQQQVLGRAVAPDALARGDLVFWPGHVGIMVDAARLIHADTGRGVAVEPLAEVSRRLRPPVDRRRL